MPTSRYTVIYEREGHRFKLCKILLSSDGSYYVTCPYHISDVVSLTKQTVNYVRPEKSNATAVLEHGLIDDDDHRLKLSHHPVRTRGSDAVIWLKHPSGAVLELRVCKSPVDNSEIGFFGVDVWPAPVQLGDAKSGFALSSPTGGLRYNGDKELEGDALFACYPPLKNVSVVPMVLAFPSRDDLPYKQGAAPPSAD